MPNRLSFLFQREGLNESSNFSGVHRICADDECEPSCLRLMSVVYCSTPSASILMTFPSLTGLKRPLLGCEMFIQSMKILLLLYFIFPNNRDIFYQVKGFLGGCKNQ